MNTTSNNTEQVNNSIKSIIELTTRIDERVQLMMKKQSILEGKIEYYTDSLNELKIDIKLLDSKSGITLQNEVHKCSEKINQIQSKLSNLENKLDNLEKDSSEMENDWKNILKGVLSFVVQIIWVVMAAYILYKLGIQSPAVP